MEIGLDLTAVYENGEILTKDVLDIDEEAYIADITTAASWAYNLAVNSVYPTAETIEVLLQKAFSEGRNLAINEYILTDLTAGDTLAKVHSQMIAVASLLPDEALSEELKGAASAAASAASATPNTESASADNDTKEEPKKDEPKEDAAAGLGALFG
jgi:large subunit ribosomal protein L10